MVILFVFKSDRALSFRTIPFISASGDSLGFFAVSSSPLRVDFFTGFSFSFSFFFASRTEDVDIVLEGPASA